jgi:hypothetical protein
MRPNLLGVCRPPLVTVNVRPTVSAVPITLDVRLRRPTCIIIIIITTTTTTTPGSRASRPGEARVLSPALLGADHEALAARQHRGRQVRRRHRARGPVTGFLERSGRGVSEAGAFLAQQGEGAGAGQAGVGGHILPGHPGVLGFAGEQDTHDGAGWRAGLAGAGQNERQLGGVQPGGRFWLVRAGRVLPGGRPGAGRAAQPSCPT